MSVRSSTDLSHGRPPRFGRGLLGEVPGRQKRKQRDARRPYRPCFTTFFSDFSSGSSLPDNRSEIRNVGWPGEAGMESGNDLDQGDAMAETERQPENPERLRDAVRRKAEESRARSEEESLAS